MLNHHHPPIERHVDGDDELRHDDRHRRPLPATIPSEGYPPPPPAGMGLHPLPPPGCAARTDQMRRDGPAVAAPPPSIPTPATPPGSFARTWLRGGGGGRGSHDRLARDLRCAYSQFDGRKPPTQILSEALALSCGTDDGVGVEPPPPCFLTVLPNDPRIVVVHGMATYAEHFGARNPYQGRVLAFVGDRPENNPGDANANSTSTPPLLMAPIGTGAPDTTAQSLFGSRRRRVPRREVLTKFFEGGGCDETLHPTPDGAEVEVDHDGHLDQLPKLAYVPPSWAARFLGGPSPYDALRIGEGLAAGLPPAEGEAAASSAASAASAADPLLHWLRAACCRRSGDVRDAYRSAMSVEWTPVLLPPPHAADAVDGGGGVRGWALRRMRMLLGRTSSVDGHGHGDVAPPAPLGDACHGAGMGVVGGGRLLPPAAVPPIVVPTHHRVAPSPTAAGGGHGPNLVAASEEGSGGTTTGLDDSSSRQRAASAAASVHRDEDGEEDEKVDPWEELGISRSHRTGRKLRDGAEGVLSTIVVPASVEEAVKEKFCYNRNEPKFGKLLSDETGCIVALRGKGVTSRAFPYRYGEDGGDRMEILAEGTEKGMADVERRVLELLRGLLRRPSPSPPPPPPGSTPGGRTSSRGRRGSTDAPPRDRAASGGGGDDASVTSSTSPLYRPLTVPRKRKYDQIDDVDDDDDRGDGDGRRSPGMKKRPCSNVSTSRETRQKTRGNGKKDGTSRGFRTEGVDLKEFVPDHGVQVDDAFMSRLIGKGGGVIKKLMKKTNCKLSLNFDERKMYISGIDQRQIDEAVDIIRAYCRSV